MTMSGNSGFRSLETQFVETSHLSPACETLKHDVLALFIELFAPPTTKPSEPTRCGWLERGVPGKSKPVSQSFFPLARANPASPASIRITHWATPSIVSTWAEP